MSLPSQRAAAASALFPGQQRGGTCVSQSQGYITLPGQPKTKLVVPWRDKGWVAVLEYLKDVVSEVWDRRGAESFPYCSLIWFSFPCRLLLLFGFLLPLAPCADGLGDQNLLGKVPSLGWQWWGCGLWVCLELPWHGRGSEGWLAGGLQGVCLQQGLLELMVVFPLQRMWPVIGMEWKLSFPESSATIPGMCVSLVSNAAAWLFLLKPACCRANLPHPS